MWILYLIAALFLAAGLSNTVGPDRDWVNALICYALALFVVYLGRLLRRNQGELDEFCVWLLENRQAIEQGTARRDGIPIDEDTVLVQYQAAICLFVVSFKVRSRYYILEMESSPSTALQFTLFSLLLGWWELKGPAATIDSVVSNLRGGKRTRLGDVLDQLTGYEREVVHLTERAAESARRIMVERRFPDGSAIWVEVEGRPASPRYQITYDDQPPTDGSAWRSESHGVMVLVRKKDAPRLAGLIVDFLDGDFTFKEGKRIHINPDIWSRLRGMPESARFRKWVISARLFGGGMKVGQVIGSTDKLGGSAASRPVHYQDVLATIYYNMGIDPHAFIRDKADRPVFILPSTAEPIRELI